MDGGGLRAPRGRRVGAQHRGVSRPRERALCGDGTRAVRDPRQRGALEPAQGGSADDDLRRHRDPAADEGSGARDAWPQSLDPGRCEPIANWTPVIAAAKAYLFPVPRATLLLYWEDVSNMNHYFYTAENPAEGAAFTYYAGARGVDGAAAGDARDGDGDGHGDHERGRPDVGGRDPSRALGPALSTAAGVGGARRRGRRRRGWRGRPGSEKPGQVQLPIPSHPIAQRGILVAPGTFKVALEVDGTVVATRSFEVRSDPAPRSRSHSSRRARRSPSSSRRCSRRSRRSPPN